MKLDLDKLYKLVRLANNNPNEHEANSAARAVCKMLDGIKFNIKTTQRPAETYEDIKRSQEPWPSHNPFWNMGFDYSDLFRKAKEAQKEQQKYKKQSDDFWDAYKYTYPYEQQKQEKPKRNLKCTKCNQEKETIFTGHEFMFVCQDCIWTEWEEYRNVK